MRKVRKSEDWEKPGEWEKWERWGKLENEKS